MLALVGYFNVVERRRELGILRVHGASSTLIVTLLLSESLLLAFPATGLGILLTYFARFSAAEYFPKLLIVQIAYVWWPIAGAL